MNDSHIDPELVRLGDSRNVVDKYRNWKVEAIRSDLDSIGTELCVAIENLERDFNMGTIIRSANAFGVRTVYIIGRKQWNKRGAMMTDKYLHIEYFSEVNDFLRAMKQKKKEIIAFDTVVGAKPLHQVTLPKNAVLLFGAEGPGISEDLLSQADQVVAIEQFGSTRSVNVGVAAGIAMYAWLQQNTLK